MSENVKISNHLAMHAKELIQALNLAGKRYVFISDKRIWNHNKSYFQADYLALFSDVIILDNPKADHATLEKIRPVIQGCDFILCLGSGTVNDLSKFIAFENQVPYAVFASAASMNGYVSKNASITINGHKKTLPAMAPIAVFCDLGILKAAPIALTKAGIGDAMCFYSCWFDWYLSHQVLGTKFDVRPFEMLQEKMAFFVKNYQKFSIYDDALLELLIDILLLSGEGMSIAGGSYPASQSEHLIAHAMTMKYPNIAENSLHGAQIAVTSLTASRVQKELLKLDKAPVIEADISFPHQKMQAFFGADVSVECENEFNEKLDALQGVAVRHNLEENWPNIRKELEEIYCDDAVLSAIFSHFEMDVSVESLGLSASEYEDCRDVARFIRNRLTCLDLV